jgi:pilus assembly protein CpaF
MSSQSYQIDLTAKNASTAFNLIRARLLDLFDLLDEPGVTEVKLNGRSGVFITKSGRRMRVEDVPITEIAVTSAVIELASSMGQEAVASTPSGNVDAKMPGYRLSAILHPIASNGTLLTIRKHSPQVLSLGFYVSQGLIPETIAEFLRKKVVEGANIVIGGGTDSGKTTFLNALSREIPKEEAVLTIEDTRELSLVVDNWQPLETNASRGVTATLLLKAAMRQSPDRIICGELRDGCAADFISSANTGHHGCMATVHCDSAALALERLEDLVLQSETPWPYIAAQRNIGRAVDLVIHFKKENGKRLLTAILEVERFDPLTSMYSVKPIFNHQE